MRDIIRESESEVTVRHKLSVNRQLQALWCTSSYLVGRASCMRVCRSGAANGFWTNGCWARL